MKTSLHDIARELDISTAAVSKALNDLPGISNELRLKIKKTAEAMGYTKHLRRARQSERESGMKFIVVLYGRIGGHLIEEIQMGVVGVLACYIKLSDVHIARLQERHIAVTLLENQTEFGRCVTIDNFKASHKAVRKLISMGRRRIGCIMPQEDVDHVWQDRLNGYRKALKETRVPYDPSLIVYENFVGMKEAELATLQLLQRRPDTDAILYGCDHQAFGGLKALQRAERRVPQQVAVIGFDDMPYDHIVQPSLSSVRQPIRKMAETGLRFLFESIEKGDYSHRAAVLDTELILRGSCLEKAGETT